MVNVKTNRMLRAMLKFDGFSDAMDRWNVDQLTKLHAEIHERRRAHEEELLNAEMGSQVTTTVPGGQEQDLEEPPFAWPVVCHAEP